MNFFSTLISHLVFEANFRSVAGIRRLASVCWKSKPELFHPLASVVYSLSGGVGIGVSVRTIGHILFLRTVRAVSKDANTRRTVSV